LLTRPAGRNDALAARLRKKGFAVRCAPLLTVAPHPQALLNWPDPAAYDLVVFVSGYAAQCWLRCWQQQPSNATPSVSSAGTRTDARVWPAHTLAATVGTASAQPLREAGLPPAQLVHPPRGVAQDSESLWQQLQRHVAQWQTRSDTPSRRSPRVLIVGAGQGRDWLQRQLQAHGCAVERYAVYDRQAAQWQEDAAACLREALDNPAQTGRTETNNTEATRTEADHTRAARPVILLTSILSVQALDANLRSLGLTQLYARGRFLVIHPRIAHALQQLAQDTGPDAAPDVTPDVTLDVTLSAPDDDAILAAIEQMTYMQAATITP